jgi:hypothetical protein
VANEDRLHSLAQQLIEATRARRVTWTATGTDRFQLSLPTGAVVIESPETGYAAMHVYDDSGNHIESLNETNATAPWDDTLHALWDAARNSALNIDKVLDSILEDVERAGREPADDDIPF